MLPNIDDGDEAPEHPGHTQAQVLQEQPSSVEHHQGQEQEHSPDASGYASSNNGGEDDSGASESEAASSDGEHEASEDAVATAAVVVRELSGELPGSATTSSEAMDVDDPDVSECQGSPEHAEEESPPEETGEHDSPVAGEPMSGTEEEPVGPTAEQTDNDYQPDETNHSDGSTPSDPSPPPPPKPKRKSSKPTGGTPSPKRSRTTENPTHPTIQDGGGDGERSGGRVSRRGTRCAKYVDHGSREGPFGPVAGRPIRAYCWASPDAPKHKSKKANKKRKKKTTTKKKKKEDKKRARKQLTSKGKKSTKSAEYVDDDNDSSSSEDEQQQKNGVEDCRDLSTREERNMDNLLEEAMPRQERYGCGFPTVPELPIEKIPLKGVSLHSMVTQVDLEAMYFDAMRFSNNEPEDWPVELDTRTDESVSKPLHEVLDMMKDAPGDPFGLHSLFNPMANHDAPIVGRQAYANEAKTRGEHLHPWMDYLRKALFTATDVHYIKHLQRYSNGNDVRCTDETELCRVIEDDRLMRIRYVPESTEFSTVAASSHPMPFDKYHLDELYVSESQNRFDVTHYEQEQTIENVINNYYPGTTYDSKRTFAYTTVTSEYEQEKYCRGPCMTFNFGSPLQRHVVTTAGTSGKMVVGKHPIEQGFIHRTTLNNGDATLCMPFTRDAIVERAPLGYTWVVDIFY